MTQQPTIRAANFRANFRYAYPLPRSETCLARSAKVILVASMAIVQKFISAPVAGVGSGGGGGGGISSFRVTSGGGEGTGSSGGGVGVGVGVGEIISSAVTVVAGPRPTT